MSKSTAPAGRGAAFRRPLLPSQPKLGGDFFAACRSRHKGPLQAHTAQKPPMHWRRPLREAAGQAI